MVRCGDQTGNEVRDAFLGALWANVHGWLFFHGVTIVSCLRTCTLRQGDGFSAPRTEVLSVEGKQQLSHNPEIKRNFIFFKNVDVLLKRTLEIPKTPNYQQIQYIALTHSHNPI